MIFQLFFLLLLFQFPSSLQFNGSDNIGMVEKAYINWAKGFQSSKYPLFQKAKNKLKPCLTLKVDKNPDLGHFVTIQEAIHSVPEVNGCRVVIFISQGVYREKVEIPATLAYITLVGAGVYRTIIEWNDTADRTGKTGLPLGTYASATFAINAPYFIAKNITFKVNLVG